MERKRDICELIFSKIPYYEYMNAKFQKKEKGIKYWSIDEDLFHSYATRTFSRTHNLTFDESMYYWRLLKDQTTGKAGVYSVVYDLAETMLTENEDTLACRYEHVLRWRDLTFKVDQDIFTTAYYAQKDLKSRFNRKFFGWNSKLKTDHVLLNSMLSKGVAENHFHLKGSSNIISVNWIHIMNNIVGRSEFKTLEPRLSSVLTFDTGNIQVPSFHQQCMLAAMYRFYLMNFICEYNQSFGDLKEISYSLKELRNELYSIEDNPLLYSLSVSKLQKRIEVFKINNSQKFTNDYLDYAILKSLNCKNNPEDPYDNTNRLMSGERFLLYSMFKVILSNSDCFTDEKEMFLRYIQIKNSFKNEMVQLNDVKGFENFARYQGRKELFIEKSPHFEEEAMNIAINSTFEFQSLKSLEARIAPKAKTSDNLKKIEEFLSVNKEYNLFFVYHFVKRKDKSKFSPGACRSQSLRADLRKLSHALEPCITDKKFGDKIRGIDACNEEIGCRPENFAQVFRFLKGQAQLKGKRLFQTYHVGEDFIDIVDGLRAVEESILFCNLDTDDRLGHGLALGTHPQTYYEKRHFEIVAPLIDVVDDIVWLLAKVTEYNIDVEKSFLDELKSQYEYLVRILLCEDTIPSYRTYYQAWKLRGDNPKEYFCYEKPPKQKFVTSAYDSYALNPRIDDEIRTMKDVRKLYYAYHYSREFRDNGSKMTVFKWQKPIINVVSQIQRKMLDELADKRISIETNPSSNFLIGQIDKYDEHPILQFNKYCLVDSNDKNVLVSINTDDQGVFETSLEFEYAIMMAALEKSEHNLSPESIIEWLDYIRETGHRVSFGKANYGKTENVNVKSETKNQSYTFKEK